jgi:hypothetical protein
MQNNNNILTENEQTQIRLALKESINSLEDLINKSKQHNLPLIGLEQQLIDANNALNKLRYAFSVTLS